ncbi:MAG: pyridoxine 5'-phosphate synthase [Polyangiaceae bacterium]|nr:pyridoxine 5'-phosphate synthase [Polyangiaceae bacterium]
MTARVRLHVNVDHVATVRNARGTRYPDPVLAAGVCELAGADGITCHLREDRRHIVDDDVARLRAAVQTALNFECAATAEMRDLALGLRPEIVTLVPERREERTTEGGLDVAGQERALAPLVGALSAAGIAVSMFVAPVEAQLAASRRVGAHAVELHTGEYCHLSGAARDAELARLRAACEAAHGLGLRVAAGHGLTRHNVGPIAALPHMEELNIGHALVADALFSGLAGAVRDIRAAIDAR